MSDLLLAVLSLFGMVGIAFMVVGYGALAALLPTLLVAGMVAPFVDRRADLPTAARRVTEPAPPADPEHEASVARKTA